MRLIAKAIGVDMTKTEGVKDWFENEGIVFDQPATNPIELTGNDISLSLEITRSLAGRIGRGFRPP